MAKKELSVSVIMPTFDINKSEEALRHIFKQDYPLKEIIVVNDNPNSKPKKSMIRFLKSKKIKLINNRVNEGIAKSLNVGIQSAKAEVIIVLCRDHFPEGKNWIRKIIEKLSSDERIGAVVCPFVWPAEAWGSYSFLTKLFTFRHISNPQYGGIYYKKEVFDKVGLFNTKNYVFAGEDCDMSTRMKKGGYQMKRVENRVMHIHYDKKSNLLGVFQKEYRYGGAHGTLKREYGILKRIGMFDFEIRLLFIFGFLIGLFTNKWLSLFCILPFFLASLVQAIGAFRKTRWLPGLILYPFAGILVLMVQTLGAVEGFVKGRQDK